jgi:hypothetical protein
MLIKMLVVCLEIFMIALFLHWWAVPVDIKKKRKNALDDIDKTEGFMIVFARFFYSPLLHPVKFVIFIVFSIFITTKWIR